jgi:predicted lipid-binding transport protein (Tim44 family)
LNGSRFSGILVLVIVLVLLAGMASMAWARAGGGQSYGSSRRSGGGGGEGLGIIFYWLVMLAIEQPAIGVPLLIAALVVFMIWGRKAKGRHESKTITKATRLNRQQQASDRDEILTALTQRDPGFTEAGFLQRSNRAFIAIQDAWSNQDLDRVRHFISDGVNERFSIQIDMQKSEGTRNQMEDVRILESKIVSMTSDRNYDTIHVEIMAQARDTDVSLETGRVIRINTTAPFTEYWSFLRKPGVKTLTDKGLVEGFCPNCGAHMELSDTGRCENCDSIVTSGQYDWVLTEITQSMEWGTLSNPEMIPGYSVMVQRDPAFNIQHVEDKTSVVFWRMIRAWFDSDPDAARKVLFPEYLESLEKQMANVNQEDWWLFFREAALGAVEIQKIIPGEEGSRDRIEVLVKWSARNAQRNRAGSIRGEGDKTIRPQIYLMARNQGVTTNAQMSFMSSHCPACAAPYEGGDTGACDYCGRPLNDGSQDWSLEAVQRFEASRITSEAVSGIERAALIPPDLVLSAMVSAMYADGEVDDKEMKALVSFAQSRNIPDDELHRIVASVASGQDSLPVPETTTEAREILAAMARMVLADGKVTREEQALMTSFGESMHLAAADVKMILTQQRKLLYQQAKTTIRENR